MPYITPERRKELDKEIHYLANALKLLRDSSDDAAGYVGDLNYTISELITKVIPDKRYKHINEIVGVLESLKLEFYRRYAGPYEDLAVIKNGDTDGYKKV